MTSGDMISLLGYYIGILAIALAFFASKVDAWRAHVVKLESEWSESEQKANTQVKLRQQAEKATLKSTTPYFSILAPLILGLTLLGLGYLALQKASQNVSKEDFTLFLLVPSLFLLLIYVIYTLGIIKSGSNKLKTL